MKAVDTNFLTDIFGNVTAIREKKINHLQSITGRISLQNSIHHYVITQNNSEKEVVCKFLSNKIIRNGIALLSGGKNFELWFDLIFRRKLLAYDNTCRREISIYRHIDPSLEKYLFKIYGMTYLKKEKVHVICMEYREPSKRKVDHYKVLDAILDFHVRYYQDDYSARQFQLNHYSASDYRKGRHTLKAMLDSVDNHIFKGNLPVLYDFINHIDEHYHQVMSHRSLTHNDFTPRNIYNGDSGVCLYDWELSCFQNPEHDLIEYLVYNLRDIGPDHIADYINYYREKLCGRLNLSFSDREYREILMFNLLEYCVNRLSLYRLANRVLKETFIDDMTLNANDMMAIVGPLWKS